MYEDRDISLANVHLFCIMFDEFLSKLVHAYVRDVDNYGQESVIDLDPQSQTIYTWLILQHAWQMDSVGSCVLI